MAAAKSALASKTQWFNASALALLIALLETAQGSEFLADYPQAVIYIGFAVTIGNMVLRQFSGQPLKALGLIK